MIKKYLIASLLTISFSLSGNSQCVSNPSNIYTFTYQNRTYEVIKETKTWHDAVDCAVERGGRLAEITTQQEQDSVYHYVQLAGISNANTIAPDGGGASYVWLGAHDHDVEGSWVWDGDDTTLQFNFYTGTYPTGTPVGGAYNNWGDEPDNFNGTQDAMGLALTNWPLGVAGQWNDINETNRLYFVIEYQYNTTNVNKVEKDQSFKVFPNPSNGETNITAIKKDILSIYNNAGILVETVDVEPGSNTIDFSHLSEGTYSIKSSDLTITEKLVIIK